MTVMTPEHWNGETKALAAKLATHQASPTLEERALFAIATELADLREALLREPPMDTMLSTLPTPGLEGAVDEYVQTLQSLDSDNGPEQLTEQARYALLHNECTVRFVGWYCPGGHRIPDHREHRGLDELAIPSVRLEDPCLHAVPMYVLVR